jgi:hypothetical protein
MPNIINADNGVVSGFAGVRTTADGTGNLALQSNGVTVLTLATNNTVTIAGTLTTASQGISYSSMPAGSVLQVVNAAYSTQVTTTSATYITTGLTASITPKFSTSKILILVSQNGFAKSSTNTYMGLRLIVGASTVLAVIGTELMYNNAATPNTVGGSSISYLDSPATTSSVTYTTQYNNAGATGNVYVQLSGVVSTMTLLEIAA